MALPDSQYRQVKAATHLLLKALGCDVVHDENFKGTPQRVAELFSDVLDGNYCTLKPMTAFENVTYRGMVIVHHVPFYSFCAHHLLPFSGHFGVAYLPARKVLGLSKLVRIVRHFTKTPTTQEAITERSVDAIMKITEGSGASVYLTAEHMCMTLRGVKSPGSFTTTIAHRGTMIADPELRTQFVNESR